MTLSNSNSNINKTLRFLELLYRKRRPFKRFLKYITIKISPDHLHGILIASIFCCVAENALLVLDIFALCLV